ncbi:unnamed protein product [Paramecium sonneborni]|uniref:Uncharacterized protein n=1 Tax=Paramecium sonneborni TaxID=65129 RepID=A0A8S1RL00_9CILI|nr:unnamed protein product [Paramecium sonneborni]
MNFIGDPIDERGPIKTKIRYPIHREALSFVDQGSSEILITGIKQWIYGLHMLEVVKLDCQVVQESERRCLFMNQLIIQLNLTVVILFFWGRRENKRRK